MYKKNNRKKLARAIKIPPSPFIWKLEKIVHSKTRMAFNLFLGKKKQFPITISSAGCLLYDNVNNRIITILEINGGQKWYTLPAGKVDMNDRTPEETALRETYEETRLLIKDFKTEYWLYYHQKMLILVKYVPHNILDREIDCSQLGEEYEQILSIQWTDIESLPRNCSPWLYKAVQFLKRHNKRSKKFIEGIKRLIP